MSFKPRRFPKDDWSYGIPKTPYRDQFSGLGTIATAPEISTKLILPYSIFQKMLCYAKISYGEISGFGKVSVEKVKTEDGHEYHAKVKEIRIFKQIVNPAHTQLRQQDLINWYVECARAKERMSEWNLWWHSHADMGVFFSGEDDDTIKAVCGKAKSKLYSLCINRVGDRTARFDEAGEHIEDIDVILDHELEENLMKVCTADIKRLVRFERPKKEETKNEPNTLYTPRGDSIHGGLDRGTGFPNRGWGSW